jgi:glycosyltransferase involved in cell wall biosynthesis
VASLVSVIIPTYNRAAYIEEAIRSVLAQTYPSVEIIVADDGSTDNTQQVVAGFGDAVTYVSLPHRGQPAATRNGGLRVARGEFVAFLDSDDLFFPGKLATQVAAFEAHPEAGLVYSNAYFFRDDPSEPTVHALDGLPRPSGDAFPDLLRGNFLAPQAVLMRRACLDEVGVFDEDPEFFAVEDYDLFMRVSAKFTVVYVPGDVAAMRRHSQSISRDAANLRLGFMLVLQKMETMYPDLVRQHRDALNEGYARNHGAVALAKLEQRQVLPALGHFLQAFRYNLRTPGYGTGAFLQWVRRRRVRGRGAMA